MQKIVAEDLLNYQYVENVRYNPSGSLLAFQKACADEKKNTYRRDIWMLKEGKLIQLTDHFNASIVMWLDDTHLLIQQADSEENIMFEYLCLDVESHTASLFIRSAVALYHVERYDDHTLLALGGVNKEEMDAWLDDEEKRKARIEEKKKDADYEVFDEIPYWFNGRGVINGNRSAFFVIHLDPFQMEIVTEENQDVHDFVINDTRVYLAVNDKKKSSGWHAQLLVYDMEKKTLEDIYTKDDMGIEDMFVLNHVLYLRAGFDREDKSTEYKAMKYVDGQFAQLPYIDRSLGSSIATDTVLGGGRSQQVAEDLLYTTAVDVDHSCIWKINEKMEKEELLQFAIITCLSVTQDKIAFIGGRENDLPEVYEMDKDGKNLTKLTSFNDAYFAEHAVSLPQELIYVSHDEELNGWVLLPYGYEKGKKYPAVLDVHGGPRGTYGTALFHEMQIWASAGYFVFYTNIHGSDGRGNAFADIFGKYGSIDYDNLMDFTDTVLKAYPDIDENNVCVTGGSYGGFMTNWIIGHTDRFKAAASQRSISNWMSFAYISDIGPSFTHSQHKVDNIIDEYERLWDFSPLKYANHATTPTLFIHSDEDYRCPMAEGMQMMQALLHNHIESKMVLFHGENHELSRGGKPLHRIRRLNEITGWFIQHTDKE